MSIQGRLPIVAGRCSVMDPPGSSCILPVRYVLVPGSTSHCELHGPDGVLYREHMKTEGWREALASGRARWVGVR